MCFIRIRCLGEFRLYLFCALRLFFLRKYPVSIFILKSEFEDKAFKINENGETTIRNEYSINYYYESLKAERKQKEQKEKEVENIKEIEGKSTKEKSKEEIKETELSSKKLTNNSESLTKEDSKKNRNSEVGKNDFQNSTFKVTDNNNNSPWIVLNDLVSSFVSSSLSHYSESMNAIPLAVSDDGYTDMFYSSRSTGCTQTKLFHTFLFKHDNGDYFLDNKKKSLENFDHNIGFDYRKVKSFIFIPKKNEKDTDLEALDYSLNGDKKDQRKEKNYLFTNSYAMDGERYDIQPLQVTVINKALKVFGFKV